MFKNYIKELIGTITVSLTQCSFHISSHPSHQASPRSLSCLSPSNTVSCTSSGLSALSRDGLSDDQSDCSSEVSIQVREVTSPKSSNTLLAMASVPSPEKTFSMDRESGDPDLLWRRTNLKDKIGKMNSMGRYEPGWDLAPCMNRNDGTKKTSR